jgi:hypothetical protein
MTCLLLPSEPPVQNLSLKLIPNSISQLKIPANNQDLNNEITRLAGHINTAQYRFLKLLAALIERNAWGGDSGIKSPAHWLNYYCGIALGAAREKVRVAQCLNSLSLIDQAFQTGEISYSKVRAMTRSATAENEEFLLGIAKHGTAEHIENLIRKYQRVERLQSLDVVAKDTGDKGEDGKCENQHQAREFSSYYDDDGMLVFKGKLAPEEGAVFMKALEVAFSQLDERDVPAGTSFAEEEAEEAGEGVEEYGESGEVNSAKIVTADGRLDRQATYTKKRADALVFTAEQSLHGEGKGWITILPLRVWGGY